METTMNNKVKTSSAALGHFIYDGLYETYIGELVSLVPYDKREKVNDEIGELYCEELSEFMYDVLPSDIDDELEITYVGTFHPRYYNYETDSINFVFKYSNAVKDWIRSEVKYNGFDKFLADNFTDRDGFLSFTPNNRKDWSKGFNRNDWRCVSAALWYIADNESNDGYKLAFNEDVYELITENYVPYEYAEQFSNGMIGVVTSEYDEENDCEYFDAYLIDVDGSIVNHVKMNDEWNELYGSAFAAWNNNDIVYDLTDGYSYCDSQSKPCKVPEFDKAVA
jgi:hypothetical protein